MENLRLEYEKVRAALPQRQLELSRLSKIPRSIPQGVMQSVIPVRLQQTLQRAVCRRNWPWFFHGDGSREVAGAVYRTFQGSALWIRFVDLGSRHVDLGLCRAVDLLVIDEVAAVPEHSTEALLSLLRARDQRPFVIIGAKSPEVLDKVVRSKILAAVVIDVSRSFRSRPCERGLPLND